MQIKEALALRHFVESDIQTRTGNKPNDCGRMKVSDLGLFLNTTLEIDLNCYAKFTPLRNMHAWLKVKLFFLQPN